ncbi:MAG: ABC transporter ATP-binding protein [Phycisphaerales bacterium]|nr:ABC transporter ATP-binding protein [Phycisphaerales bacterium]
MSSDCVIAARGLGKAYTIYHRPIDRLKQMLFRGRRNYYQEFWALHGVDLEVYRGETVGIIGRNGAGKSTLLQLICGTVTPTTGELSVRGRVAALLELGSGFNPEFTGRENVYLNAALLGMRDHEIHERFAAIEAFADIGTFIDQPVRTYSSGMHARLAFSVAIHVDPEILIVDEILAVGDAAFQRKCVERFYKIRDSGCTILFVSHDPYLVKSICQRAIYLRGGERVAYGKAEEVIDRYITDMERVNAASRTPTDGASEPATPPPPPGQPFRITEVHLENPAGQRLTEVQSGQDIQLRMRYVALDTAFPSEISFVVNLYRHDDFYIYGTTTLMEGLPPYAAAPAGEVIVRFPRIQLLAGEYKWRIAINDHRGLGILADAKHVCAFRVVDRFQAVGLVDLPKQWLVRTLPDAQQQVR